MDTILICSWVLLQGEIRATAFNEQVDKFFPLIDMNKVCWWCVGNTVEGHGEHEGDSCPSGNCMAVRSFWVNLIDYPRAMACLLQVYYISKGTLKIANKQFTAVKNDYEMTFNNETSVMPCEDGHHLPTVQFDFTGIGDLENKSKDSLIGKSTNESKESWDYSFLFATRKGRLECLLFSLGSCCDGSMDHFLLTHCAYVLDIIGICKSYEDAIKITVKSNNREVSKRNLYLMDMSGKVVTTTLWGEDVGIRTGQPERMQKAGM